MGAGKSVVEGKNNGSVYKHAYHVDSPQHVTYIPQQLAPKVPRTLNYTNIWRQNFNIGGFGKKFHVKSLSSTSRAHKAHDLGTAQSEPVHL